MTKNEINFVLDKIGINPNVILNCEGIISSIGLLQGKTVFPNKNANRICFDMSNEIIKIYYCDKTDLAVPKSSWIEKKDYDMIDGVIYKYLLDNVTNMPIFYFFYFDSITSISIC